VWHGGHWSPFLSSFVRLFVLNFLFNCAQNSTSLLPPYLVSLGAGQGYVGLYNTLGIWLIVVAVVFFGRPLVNLPRVATLRWGYVCLLISYLGSWLWADQLLVLMLVKVVGSLGWVFSATLMVSLLLDLTPAHQRAGGIAVFSIAGMLTNPVTTLAGEAVFQTWGGPALFVLGGAFAVVTLGWSFLLREPQVTRVDEAPASFWTVVVRRELRPLVVLAFAFGVFYSALSSFLPHHTLVTLGRANLSAFLVPFSVVSVVLRFTLGRTFDRHPPRRFLSLSFLAVLVAMVLLLLPASWPWIAAAGVCYGLGHSVLYPLLNTLFVQAGGEDQKAVYSNVYLVANLLGAVVTTPLLGFLGDAFGFSSVIAVLAVVAAGSLLLVRARFPRATRPTSE